MSADPVSIDAVAAEHLLHLTFTQRFGMDWRLECVHAPDDERWFPTPADGLNDYDAGCCWTISWFEEDGIECVVADWSEPISFPVLVHCWWDNEAMRIEPAAPSADSLVVNAADALIDAEFQRLDEAEAALAAAVRARRDAAGGTVPADPPPRPADWPQWVSDRSDLFARAENQHSDQCPCDDDCYIALWFRESTPADPPEARP